jgi:hypothetical protein
MVWLQLPRAVRGPLQDRVYFENLYRLIGALLRRGQLNAEPLGRTQRRRRLRSR